ncbi:MAG TPA: hypothetical protein VGB70_08760 [Allosphingosinicella sp.]|jgi:hypothetical protein
MTLAFRHKLPWLIAAAWLWGSWEWVLGAPSLREMLYTGYLYSLSERFSEFEAIGWFALLIVTMLLADRLLCLYADWRWGIDPLKVHWSRLRGRDGGVLCAACLSPFMMPPGDLHDESYVHCGDCGHAVAPYGEMKRTLGDPLASAAARVGARL